jgi:hypothetical protein
MTKTKGKRQDLLHQDTRNLSSLACFLSPRRKQESKQYRREVVALEKTSHGVVRAIESLRRLRMSLVPRLEPWECLLPAV